MKKQIGNIKDLIGKTISGSRLDDGDLLITFADDTFIKFHPDYYYEDLIIVISDPVSLVYGNRGVLHSLGIASEDEIKAAFDESDRNEKERQEKLDRDKYEMLKRRFEG